MSMTTVDFMNLADELREELAASQRREQELNAALRSVTEESAARLQRIEKAVLGMLAWVEPMAGDNRDKTAAAAEVSSVNKVKEALSPTDPPAGETK